MNWAWFFDIDGTLVEIADVPGDIVVRSDVSQLLGELHSLADGALALITGRSIADVDRIMPMHETAIAGQHGLELRLADGTLVAHPVRAENLGKVRLHLLDAIEKHEGLMAEYKGLSIALHYRNAPRLAGYAHRMIRSLRARYLPDFVIQKGKRVVELKPAGKDKGVAISELMMVRPFEGRTPVFIGDDATDELGFKVVNELGGHSIKIGAGRTNAKWRLPDVGTLIQWLSEGVRSASETAK